jgi:hypothetical protein
MLWIFLWDDEIDGAGTIVSQSESHASIYCQNSLEFARLVLGLGEIDSKQSNKHSRDLQNLSCPVPTMVYFQDASEVLRTALNLSAYEHDILGQIAILTQCRSTQSIT